jgi:hypothetical protein
MQLSLLKELNKTHDMNNISFVHTFWTKPALNDRWDVNKIDQIIKNIWYRMFFNSEFNGNISNWNVSNVENMESMFLWSVFNQPLDKWNVSNVENMKEMFNRSKFNQNISKWKINKKCITTDMFEYCKIKEEYKPNLVK